MHVRFLTHVEDGVEHRVLCTNYDALNFSAAAVEVHTPERGTVSSMLYWGVGLRARDGCEVIGCWWDLDDAQGWSGVAADLFERGLWRVTGPIRLEPEAASQMSTAEVALACFRVRSSCTRRLDASVEVGEWRPPRVWAPTCAFDTAVQRALRRHGTFSGPVDARAFAVATLARMERRHLQDLQPSHAGGLSRAGDRGLAPRPAAHA